MIARYEKLEEYFEAIKGETKQPVYIGFVRLQNEYNNLSFQIHIQVVTTANNNMVLTYVYTDLPTFKIIPDGTFEAYLGQSEATALAKKKYENALSLYTKSIVEEKEKIMEKLKATGFTKFENATIM